MLQANGGGGSSGREDRRAASRSPLSATRRHLRRDDDSGRSPTSEARGRSHGGDRHCRDKSPVRDNGADTRRERRDRSAQGSSNNDQGDLRPTIYVTNLSPRTDNRDLEDGFSKIGKVTKASVMYDPHTRESRGFGFIDFATVEDAQNAVQNADSVMLHGRRVRAEMARRGRPRTPTPGRYYGLSKNRPRYETSPHYDSRRSPDPSNSYRRRELSPPFRGAVRHRDAYHDRDHYPERSRGSDRYSSPPHHYDCRGALSPLPSHKYGKRN